MRKFILTFALGIIMCSMLVGCAGSHTPGEVGVDSIGVDTINVDSVDSIPVDSAGLDTITLPVDGCEVTINN